MRLRGDAEGFWRWEVFLGGHPLDLVWEADEEEGWADLCRIGEQGQVRDGHVRIYGPVRIIRRAETG